MHPGDLRFAAPSACLLQEEGGVEGLSIAGRLARRPTAGAGRGERVYGHFEKATRRREAEAIAGVFGV